jgi:hypothetical protein
LPAACRSDRGTSAESELVPLALGHERLSAVARESVLTAGAGANARRESKMWEMNVVEGGRRLVPSAGKRAQTVGRERGVNDAGAARLVRPRPLFVGVVHAPPCRCPFRRARSFRRPADLPDSASTMSRSQHVIRVGDPPAITSGSMRARRVAVEGSPLRSDRAPFARLARVRVGSWTIVVFSERETLTAPLPERGTLALA